MANQLRSKYDIVINGGGIVGFTLLNLIFKSRNLNRAKVLLIEQSNQPVGLKRSTKDSKPVESPELKVGDDRFFSNRVSSVTHASRTALKRLGVWDSVRSHSKDVRKICVWNYNYRDKLEFRQNSGISNQDFDKEDREVLFSVVENCRLSNALLENIVDRHGMGHAIAWSRNLHTLEESLEKGFIDLRLKDQHGNVETISAALLLGCDGFKSRVRESTGIRYTECDLKKTAVAGTVKISPQISNSENDIAYQRFSPQKDTVAALLPLDNNYSSFVISAPNEYANFLRDSDEETFLQEFNQLLSADETAPSLLLRGLHEFSNASYDNLKTLLQVIGPRLGISRGTINYDCEHTECPSLDCVVNGSRATFPLMFGTTSPRMVGSLPGLDRLQIALLGDSSHRVHPLAGQGLNLGIQDAVELVGQLDEIAESGERIFGDSSLIEKALRRYEIKRQAYVIPMSLSILSMQKLFELAPSRMISSLNMCAPVKRASVRIANGSNYDYYRD